LCRRASVAGVAAVNALFMRSFCYWIHSGEFPSISCSILELLPTIQRRPESYNLNEERNSR
jgi:hypothetical protein